MIFGVYQDWVHQNPGNHLYFRITEDGKGKAMWKNLSICLPKAMTYRPEILGKIVATLSVDIEGVQYWNYHALD